MTSQEAFVQAIIEDPDDDDVRLIFADWLEEHGDPRAELIRLQIELARYAPAQRPTALTQREHALLCAHGRAWAGRLPEFVLAWNFHRGFIDEVTIRTQDFAAVIHDIVRLAPLVQLTLRFDKTSAAQGQFAEDAASFGTDPPLTRIRTLDLSDNHLTNWDVRTICSWTSLDRLEILDLSNNPLSDFGVRALAAAEVFPRLTHLDLRNTRIIADGVRALEEALALYWERGQGPRLQTLDLRDNRLSASAHQFLQRSRFLKRVALFDRPAPLGASEAWRSRRRQDWEIPDRID